jgi:hypothetical protein
VHLFLSKIKPCIPDTEPSSSNSPIILARSHSHAKSKQLSRPCGLTGEPSARVYQQAGDWFLSVTDAENHRTHPHLIHMQMALSQLNATLVCSPSPPMINYDDKLGIASGRVIAYVQRFLVAQKPRAISTRTYFARVLFVRGSARSA